MHCVHGTENPGELGLNCLERTQLKKAVREETGGGEQTPRRPAGVRGTVHVKGGAAQRRSEDTPGAPRQS